MKNNDIVYDNGLFKKLNGNYSQYSVPPATETVTGGFKAKNRTDEWLEVAIDPETLRLYAEGPSANASTGGLMAPEDKVKLDNLTENGTVLSQHADYAEVGEWRDGNPDLEDRIGYFVCIDYCELDEQSTRIIMRKAAGTDDVRGVTMQQPGFAGNASVDKFDETTGKLLAKYDYVAVMGIVPVIDKGRCEPGEHCMPSNDGTAIPSSNDKGYYVINRIDESRILIIVEPGADAVNKITSDIIDINTVISTMDSGMKDLEDDINDTIKTSIDNIKTDINDTIKTSIDTIEADIVNIEKDVDNIEGSIQTINSDIITINSNISNIESGISTSNTAIGGIEVDIDNIEVEIDGINTDLGELRKYVDTVNNKVQTNIEDIKENNSSIKIINSNINIIQGDVTDLKTSYPAKNVTTDSTHKFVTDAQINSWNSILSDVEEALDLFLNETY